MNAEALRQQQREEWTMCAPGWRAYRDNFVEPSRPITERMIGLAQVRQGQRVLDLACGYGNPTFDLAEAVGPDGYVLGLDLSEAMVRTAREWASRHGVTNVEFRTIDSELELGVQPASFDLATCRAGMQYMPDQVGCARAVYDALRPGSRFVTMTLGAPERCMPYMLTNAAVARHVRLPELGTDRPGPVGLSTVARLEGVLTAAGFSDVRTDVLVSPIFEAADPPAAWQLFTKTAGPFMALFASLDDDSLEAIREDAIRTFAETFPNGPIRPTGEVLVACGAKPA
jgi:SAM-dependent methyltransferase